MSEATSAPERLGLRAAPLLLWFGVLGAGIAWSLHTLVGWGIDETVCRSGHTEMLGVPLRGVLLASTALFLVVALASTAVAYRLWRRLTNVKADDEVAQLRLGRASFMAVSGFTAGLIFSLIITLGGVGVVSFPVCGFR